MQDDEGTKWQIAVRFHGGNVTWSRKHGHHNPWENHKPTDADWDKLLAEAERRLPRRLMSRKQFEQLRSRRPQ